MANNGSMMYLEDSNVSFTDISAEHCFA